MNTHTSGNRHEREGEQTSESSMNEIPYHITTYEHSYTHAKTITTLTRSL